MTDEGIVEVLRRLAETRRRGHSVHPSILRAAADEIGSLREDIALKHEDLQELGARLERLRQAVLRVVDRQALESGAPGNAPGHRHQHPPRWDGSEDVCEWCLYWSDMTKEARDDD